MQKRVAALFAFGVVSFVLACVVVSAFWPFATGKAIDDYSNPVFTLSGSSKSGLQGGASVVTEGVDGNGVSFDGLTGYYMVAEEKAPTPAKEMSIGGWFKTSTLRNGNNEITGSWISKRNSYSLDPETDGSVKFWAYVNDVWYQVSSPANSIQTGAWEHWMGTYDGETLSLYKNGELMGSATALGAMGTTGDFCIGHDCGLAAPHDNRYFNGMADEVRVYTDDLSAGAVKRLYEEQKAKITTQTSSTSDSSGGIYPTSKGCIKSPVYSGDACGGEGQGYRIVRSLTAGVVCYTFLDACLQNQGEGTCVPSPAYAGDTCGGYRVMDISRACYTLGQCTKMLQNTNGSESSSGGSGSTGGGAGGSSACTDSDNGVDLYVRGEIKYFYDVPSDQFYGTHISQDTCSADGKNLIEYSCSYYSPKELGPSKTFDCPNGCDSQLGACKGSTTNSTTSTGSTSGGGGQDFCVSGCSVENKCLPYGTRVKGAYCALSGKMATQQATAEKCDNGWECKSNVCASAQCVDAGLFSKIIGFFKRVFG